MTYLQGNEWQLKGGINNQIQGVIDLICSIVIWLWSALFLWEEISVFSSQIYNKLGLYLLAKYIDETHLKSPRLPTTNNYSRQWFLAVVFHKISWLKETSNY